MSGLNLNVQKMLTVFMTSGFDRHEKPGLCDRFEFERQNVFAAFLTSGFDRHEKPGLHDQFKFPNPREYYLCFNS